MRRDRTAKRGMEHHRVPIRVYTIKKRVSNLLFFQFRVGKVLLEVKGPVDKHHIHLPPIAVLVGRGQNPRIPSHMQLQVEHRERRQRAWSRGTRKKRRSGGGEGRKTKSTPHLAHHLIQTRHENLNTHLVMIPRHDTTPICGSAPPSLPFPLAFTSTMARNSASSRPRSSSRRTQRSYP